MGRVVFLAVLLAVVVPNNKGVPLSTKLCPDDVNCNKIVAGITVTTTAPMTTTITTFPTTERGKTASPTPAAVVAKGLDPLTAAEVGGTVLGGFIVLVLSAIGIYSICLNVKKILNKHKDTRPEEPPNNSRSISDLGPVDPFPNNPDGDEETTITDLSDENVVTPNSLQHDMQQNDGSESEGGQDKDSQDEAGQDQSDQEGQDDPKYEVVPIPIPLVLPDGEQADGGNERVMDSGFASGEGGEGQVNENAPSTHLNYDRRDGDFTSLACLRDESCRNIVRLKRDFKNSYQEARPSCCSLVYSPCSGFRESFPHLIGTLQATVPHKAWLLLGPLEENARLAEFRAGSEGGTVVTIGVSECSLVMKAKVMISGKASFTEIRSWVEDGILKTHPDLSCSIYVSPCTTGSGKDWLKVVCAQNTTKVGSLCKNPDSHTRNEDFKMIYLYCDQHRKVLRPERYQHWFGFTYEEHHLRDSFKKNKDKILLKIANEIGTKPDLIRIATHLDVPKAFVDREMTTVNDSNDSTVAALNVLHSWHTSQSGNCFHFQRQDQLANAFKEAGLDKECVYRAYHLMS